MQVIVDSLVTQYESKGNGKAILLLHGWGDDHRTFDNLTNHLSKQYFTIALDLPGFGQTGAPTSAWSLDDYNEFIAHFLQKIGQKPYAIIGHSNGAALAIRAISTNKIQTDKLVLLGAAGIRTAQKNKKIGIKITAKVGKIVTFWMPKSWRQKLQRKLYGAVGSDMMVAPHLKETFKQTVAQDVQADAKLITLPTLLIYGAEDTATPVVDGKLFKQLIAGSELEVIPGAGHFVHQDAEAAITILVEEFLK